MTDIQLTKRKNHHKASSIAEISCCVTKSGVKESNADVRVVIGSSYKNSSGDEIANVNFYAVRP